MLAIVKIRFKCIARIKPIVVYDHDQRIFPPRCQLILNRADNFVAGPQSSVQRKTRTRGNRVIYFGTT